MAKEKKEKFDFVQPIKDIPAALKGFPKNIVRILKDPVKSSEEVKTRKKEIFPLLYLFIAIALIFVILSAIFSKASSVFTGIAFVPAVCAAVCVFLLMALKKAAEKFADIECDNCKKRIAYDEKVQFKVVNKTLNIKKEDKTNDKNGVHASSTISVEGKEITTVEITCRCQGCGTEKTFKHDFVTMECNKTAVKVPYVQSGALLITFESDVKNAYASGILNVEGEIVRKGGEVSVGGKSASTKTVGNDINITYNRSVESLVKGYFGDEIQMR